MNTEKIEKLAADAFDAEQRYKIMGMRNVSHLDYNEQKKAHIEYVLAQHKAIEARRALSAEMELRC